MLEVENLSKTYNINKKNALKALDDVSLSISAGEIVAITGTSGAGKSTLLHILGCVLPFESGSYKINGVQVQSLSDSERAKLRNKKIGTVFQNFLLLQDNTAFENTEVPLLLAGIKKRERKERCLKALKETGVADLAERRVGMLSGGQKQRVAIARAIVNDAQYILADEPTGALDSENSEAIFDLLCRLKEDGRGVVIVTHDLQIAEQCDRQIVLEDGKAVRFEGETTAENK